MPPRRVNHERAPRRSQGRSRSSTRRVAACDREDTWSHRTLLAMPAGRPCVPGMNWYFSRSLRRATSRGGTSIAARLVPLHGRQGSSWLPVANGSGNGLPRACSGGFQFPHGKSVCPGHNIEVEDFFEDERQARECGSKHRRLHQTAWRVTPPRDTDPRAGGGA
jgi:hypothetical protein